MNIGNYGPLGQVIFNTSVIHTQLDTLTEQASTGYVADNYGGLGAGASTALSLQPQITSLAAQQSAINQVTGQIGIAQTALTQINSIATNFKAQIATLTNVNPNQVGYVATAAQSALQQVASLLDTSEGGTYVFAGTDSSNPPIPNPSTITSTPFYTQIASAVQSLTTNGAAATMTSIVSTAQSASPFSTALSAPAATPDPLVPLVQLGTGAPVQTGILANRNTLIPATTAPNSTGSYMQDILTGLATLSNLSSSQVNDPNFSTLLQDTETNLTNAISGMGQEAGSLGNIQSTLTAQQSDMDETSTALTTQVSSVEDVNMAQTISNISQVQTQLTASYQLIAELKSLSLANYL